MNNRSSTSGHARLLMRIVAAMAAAVCALGPPAAQAQPVAAPPASSAGTSAYVTDSRGEVVRNATYLCWHTGYWSPAAAVAECDPDLVATPRALAQAPAIALPAPAIPSSPAPAPAPRSSPPVPVAQRVTLSAEALFDFDKSALKPEGRRALDELVARLAPVSLDVVIAVGHTDSIGTDAYNRRLSLHRAQAVKGYLVSRGVPADRVTADGRGEKEPVASNRTRQGRAMNRRVEVEVIGTAKP